MNDRADTEPRIYIGVERQVDGQALAIRKEISLEVWRRTKRNIFGDIVIQEVEGMMRDIDTHSRRKAISNG
jgi:hypothetical protein